MVRKSTPWYKREIHIGGVHTLDLVMFAKYFSVMLDAGVTAPEALEVLVEQVNDSFSKVLRRVDRRVQSGSMLGDAMAMEPKVFSPIMISAVVIGETSGTLSENLKQLSVQMGKDFALRRNIQSAMLYPSIVLGLAFVLGLGIATFVLPQIVDVFSSLNVELPWTTRVLIWVADIFDLYGGLISIASIIGVLFVIWMIRLPTMRPFFDRLFLYIPLVNTFFHDLNRARFCRTLGTLLDSGIPIHEALKTGAKVVPNSVYRSSLEQMVKRIASGDSLGDIMAYYPKLYPKIIHRMVIVGERSGALAKIFKDIATFYEERVEVQSKNVSVLIEPLLLIAIGLIIAVIAVSILTPIYSITSSLNV